MPGGPNTLTGTVGLRVGPLVLETLVKHYFERIRSAPADLKDGSSGCNPASNLRQDELLYDQAFNLVKAFMTTAAKHTVEELQEFSNTRTPSPPWVHVIRLYIPMSSCNDAATYVIEALGGEDITKRIVGGTKWWQVRGLKGVSAEWITARKDWKEAKQRHKAAQRQKGTQKFPTIGFTVSEQPSEADDNGTYQHEMDEQRCILYLHGGGYYFGSVDQERYSIQRFARKINGRVFAISYRLSPQYPFPCAIQDAVASYLYLIRPPPEAPHRPVRPEHIIIMGDSAGGGLSLALLQVIRDTGLPSPAGGVLVSPWCDLCHSFPSIHENTETDVIPYYGLSLHKPSTLWPPPPNFIANRVRETLKNKIRRVVQLDKHGKLKPSIKGDHEARGLVDLSNLSLQGHDLFTDTSADGDNQTLTLMIKAGEVVTIETQIQLYTPNDLLKHPLVSPVGAYLGGLPPLFFIAGDKEVLRDEIVYTAHKAAYPDRYPLKDEVKKLYPALQGIESKYGPTNVHLQVYDDCAHVLPVLFAFTTPAKFSFRAIARFCRHVTGMVEVSHVPNPPIPAPTLEAQITEPLDDLPPISSISASRSLRKTKSQKWKTKSIRNDKAAKRAWTLDRKSDLPSFHSFSHNLTLHLKDTPDVGGPRFDGTKTRSGGFPCAGDDPFMYIEPFEQGRMIRERVSTQGIIRPLESEDKLAAFQIAPEDVGVIPERSINRYLEGRDKYDKKFANTVKSIAKQREKNYQLAKKEGVKSLSHLQDYLMKAEEDKGKRQSDEEKEVFGSWNWAWALDDGERPPASSIVARRDTSEAIDLAKIADLKSEGRFSGNNLWTHLVTFFTLTPDKDGIKKQDQEEVTMDEREETKTPSTPTDDERKSKNNFWKETFWSKPASKMHDKSRNFIPSITET